MSLAPPPLPGEVFEGRYQINELLGEGGFSKVFRAVDLQSGHVIALKLLVSNVDSSLAERFQREAHVLENLNENHIIRLYNHGESEGGLLYMAFEYVEGRSLFELLRDEGAQPPARTARILQQILQALQAAHVQGILHRDIKPNNIMIVGDSDHIKVLDFGIAKSFGEPGHDLTAAGTLIGTPRYMSPEQIRGQLMAPASDIYSLGMVAIELLTGRKALAGKDRMDILRQQMSHTPNQLPNSLGIPPRLRDIVERMTAKDVRIRYASAAGVLRDLNHWEEDADDVDETMLAGQVSDVEVLTVDELTILERVESAPRETAPTHNGQAANHWAPQPSYNTIPNLTPSGNWPHVTPNPSASSSSGNWPILDPNANASLSLQTQTNAGITSSGNWPQHFENFDAKHVSFALTTPQKTILGVSCLVPGVAHLAFGQTKKGALILVIFLLSLGTGIVLTFAVVFDAYLVLRASKKRTVGDFEFFPDYRAFFS